MTAGALLQLVAKGAQDEYLTGNPQITFFKVVYKRHTNFAMESISQTIEGNIGKGNKISSKISRKGDLLYNCWLDVNINNPDTNTYYGLSVIDNIEFELGGQMIDKHYYRWIHAYMSSLVNSDESNVYESLQYIYPSATSQKIKIPFLFWFCKNPGLALPLVALQYHNSYFHITFSNYLVKSAGSISSHTIDSAKLWCNYIYLDSDERRRFSQVKHEYLIEQVQYQKYSLNTNNGINEVTTKLDLNFNHPVKYLIWYMGLNDLSTSTLDSSTSNNIYLSKCKFILNDIDRFEEQNANYFKFTQFYETNCNNQYNNYYKKSTNYLNNIDTSIQYNESLIDNTNSPLYYIYSFSLKPISHQPSGTCNFSRIDTTKIELKHKSTNTNTSNSNLHIFAINYNILRIECGLGGVAYSN